VAVKAEKVTEEGDEECKQSCVWLVKKTDTEIFNDDEHKHHTYLRRITFPETATIRKCTIR
jgi:hypothetical protein